MSDTFLHFEATCDIAAFSGELLLDYPLHFRGTHQPGSVSIGGPFPKAGPIVIEDGATEPGQMEQEKQMAATSSGEERSREEEDFGNVVDGEPLGNGVGGSGEALAITEKAGPTEVAKATSAGAKITRDNVADVGRKVADVTKPSGALFFVSPSDFYVKFDKPQLGLSSRALCTILGGETRVSPTSKLVPYGINENHFVVWQGEKKKVKDLLPLVSQVYGRVRVAGKLTPELQDNKPREIYWCPPLNDLPLATALANPLRPLLCS